MAASPTLALQPPHEVTADRYKISHGNAFDLLDDVDNESCKLVITSPPYNIGKEYERDQRLSLEDYIEWIDGILEKLCNKVSLNGHLCWQTGNFINQGELFPLDLHFYEAIRKRGLKLRNR